MPTRIQEDFFFCTKKPKMGGGGYVVFSPIYGPAWLLPNNLYKVIFKLLGGPRLGLDGPSGHYEGPHLCTTPLGDPPPPPTHTQYPNRVKSTQILPKTCFT